jgi:GGDEF domain-containing protein
LQQGSEGQAGAAGCITKLHEEIERERKIYAQRIADLKTALEDLRSGAANAPAAEAARKDPVTGLPEKDAAEVAIARAMEEQRSMFAAVFVVERLAMVNARFGSSVGNQVFQLYSTHLAQSLPQRDGLFRWTGTALVALLEREGDEAAMRSEILGISAKRFSRMIDAGSRSVLLSLGTASTIFSLKEGTAGSIVENIEEFIRSAP